MKNSIAEIVALEWESFQSVHSAQGRVPCQDDYVTFEQMRKSQFMAWNEELREHYLADLRRAKTIGRNLVAEKYARMMAFTAPNEYEQIKSLLPQVSSDTIIIIDAIVAFHLAWQKECASKYPKLAARSRPASVGGDITGDTSFANYLKGELLTYSPETLRLYNAYIRDSYTRGFNVHEAILENMVKLAGYASIQDAENKL